MKYLCCIVISFFIIGCSSGKDATIGVSSDSWQSFSITKPGYSNPETIRLVGSKLIMWKFGLGGEYYDFASSTWTTMSTVGAPNLTSRTATGVNERYMLLCGRNNGVYLGGIFDSETNTWKSFSNCSVFGYSNDSEMSSAIGDKIYYAEKEIDLSTGAYSGAVFLPPTADLGVRTSVSNGVRISLTNGTDGYYFDSTLSPISYPTQNILNSRAGMLAALVGNNYYVFGGQEMITGSYQWQSSGVMFNTGTNTWINMANNTGSVATPISAARVFTFGQNIFVFYKATATAMVADIFDTGTKLWSKCSEVNMPTMGNMFLVLSTGSAVITLTNLDGNIYSGAIYNP